MKKTLMLVVVFFCTSAVFAQQKIGTLSKNPYAPSSTANPANRYKSNSVTNPYGQYGSAYSPNGAANAYATNAPKLYAPDGTYLGKSMLIISQNAFRFLPH